MTMTRRDFNALADILHKYNIDASKLPSEYSFTAMVDDIADLCKRHNSLFDKDRFWARVRG